VIDSAVYRYLRTPARWLKKIPRRCIFERVLPGKQTKIGVVRIRGAGDRATPPKLAPFTSRPKPQRTGQLLADAAGTAISTGQNKNYLVLYFK
jgi:hypothetical protein